MGPHSSLAILLSPGVSLNRQFRPCSRRRGGRRSHFDSVQSPAEPCPHNHSCLVTVRDPIMLLLSQALVPSPHPLLQGIQGQCLYLGDISWSPQRVPSASCSAIMLSCLTATKEVEYPPQAPGDILEPLSKGKAGPALHSKHGIPEVWS